MNAANCALYFEAVRRGPLAVAVLTHYLAPLLVALLAPWVAGERRSRRTLAAMPLSLVGLLLLIGAPGGEGFPVATAALGAGSAVFYAGVVFASKRAGRRYSPLAVTALHGPVAAAALAAAFGGQVLPPPGSPWLVAAAGALVCGLLANILFTAGLARIPTQPASVLTYLEPVVAAGVGWSVFGERLDGWGLGGAALILACGAWVVSEPSPAPPAAAAIPLPGA